MSNISPQGYVYGAEPTSNNPFWDASEASGIQSVRATAGIDDTTGTPTVAVSNVGTTSNVVLDFQFTGLKGEKGEKGESGTNGTNGTNGISPVVTSTGSTGSAEIAGTVSGADGTVMTVYNGAKGDKGDTGDTGATGPQGLPGAAGVVDYSNTVTDVSIANENGVYAISQTKGTGDTAVKSDVGSIDIPNIDNVIAEVVDSVVENNTAGYDYHTIKETEHNGTQNDVGKFYLAQNQITGINSDGSYSMVDQSGNMTTGQLPGGVTVNSPDVSSYQGQWGAAVITPFLNNGVLLFAESVTSAAITIDTKTLENKPTTVTVHPGRIGIVNVTPRDSVQTAVYAWFGDYANLPADAIIDLSLNDAGAATRVLTINDGSGLQAVVSINTNWDASTTTLTTTLYITLLKPGRIFTIDSFDTSEWSVTTV